MQKEFGLNLANQFNFLREQSGFYFLVMDDPYTVVVEVGFDFKLSLFATSVSCS
jgi:hypothetical protein